MLLRIPPCWSLRPHPPEASSVLTSLIVGCAADLKLDTESYGTSMYGHTGPAVSHAPARHQPPPRTMDPEEEPVQPLDGNAACEGLPAPSQMVLPGTVAPQLCGNFLCVQGKASCSNMSDKRHTLLVSEELCCGPPSELQVMLASSIRSSTGSWQHLSGELSASLRRQPSFAKWRACSFCGTGRSARTPKATRSPRL